jgi:hypothetical protein
MFLLNFIPDSFLIWAINAILLMGLVGTLSSYFIRFIPPLYPYAGLVKTLGIVLLVLGVWFRGGYDVEMEWRDRVKEVEAKVAAAEAESKKVNTVLQKVYVDKIKLVKDLQIVIQERIVEKEKIIDAECKVAPEALDILNEAAKNPGTSK